MQASLFFLLVVGAAARGGEVGSEDHVSLLQGEVEKQSEQRKASAKVSLEKDGEASCPLSPDGPASPCAAAGAPRGAVPRSQRDGSTAAVESATVAVQSNPVLEAAPQVRARRSGPTTFGIFLDVLVVLVVCDGVRRRWIGSNAATASGDAGDWQALMQATVAGDTVRCDELLAEDVDVGRTDVWGSTLLHAAAKSGHEAVVVRLLEQHCSIDGVDACDDTPLHLAARLGHAGVCELLIEKGATTDALNEMSLTPLVVAARAGMEVTCKVLLGRGAGLAGLKAEAVPPLLRELLPMPEDSFAEMEREALVQEKEEFLQELVADM